MKQPELGKKITELRKAKGLTQEELVEKCNINVRTIQRIEAGEVTPSIYTVKTILAALDYDITTIQEEENRILSTIGKFLNKFLLFGPQELHPMEFIRNVLNTAWIGGVIYFTLGFFEAAAEYFRYEQDRILYGNSIYVILKISVLVSFIFMQRGFIVLGGLFQNYLLRIVSYFLIFGTLMATGYDILSVYYTTGERQFMLGSEGLAFGVLGILFGISLFRMKDHIGDAARFAGIFEVVAGFCFLTLVLAFIGFIIQVPAELLEIIILYKGLEMVRKSSDAGDIKTAL